MNSEQPIKGDKPISGHMFLYRQPELLTVKDHGDLGLTPADKPFEHVATERVIPLTMTEFGSAQRHYPIVFSSMDETAMPLAVTGLSDHENLFVDDGNWDPMAYIPSYLRCYPFAFASVGGDNMAAVIDRSAETVQQNAQYPFFVDGKPSKETETMMEFCVTYEQERNRTRQLCKQLAAEGLFVSQQATHRQPESETPQAFAEYISIDAAKLTKLDDAKILELHRNGMLSAMYLQLYSIENWRHLMARRIRREMAAGPG